MSATDVGAYIPCFNDAATVAAAIAGLQAQSVAPAYIVVVDDGSGDGSGEIAARAGAHVLRHEHNLGRGAARAAAMAACTTEFVVCCDAANVLSPDFLARAMPWFDDARVAAVYGRIRNLTTRTTVDRWRARYLFREDAAMTVTRPASLITFGTVVRRSAVEDAGGYDPRVRHSEDRDLGERLLRRGHDVIFDPALSIGAAAHDSPSTLLERYWRWTAGVAERADAGQYLKQIRFAWRHMVLPDVQSRDLGMALLSGFAPHYCYWRTRVRLWSGAAQSEPER
jgi:glycosyltransferase involved in cell wall biosynthesis